MKTRPIFRLQLSLRSVLALMLLIGVALVVPRQRSYFQRRAVRTLTEKGVTLFQERNVPQAFWSRVVFGPLDHDDVSVINIEGISLSSPDVEYLTAFPQLSRVILNKCGDTGQILRRIHTLPALEHLYIEGMPLSNEDVQFIAQMRQLRTLSLIDVSCSDVNFSLLGQLPELNILNMSGTAIDDRVLACASDWTSIRYLTLMRTIVSDDGIQAVGTLVQLESLAIRESEITGNLSAIARLRQLRYLDLSKSNIDDTGLRKLESISTLRVLRLNGTPISSAGVARLRRALPTCEVSSDYEVENEEGDKDI
jgi:internalin A